MGEGGIKNGPNIPTFLWTAPYVDSFKCIRYFKGVGGNTIFAFQEEEKKEEEILI